MIYTNPKFLSTWDEVEQPPTKIFRSGDLVMLSPKHADDPAAQRRRPPFFRTVPINSDSNTQSYGVSLEPPTNRPVTCLNGFGVTTNTVDPVGTLDFGEIFTLLQDPIKVNFGTWVPIDMRYIRMDLSSKSSMSIDDQAELLRLKRRSAEKFWYLKVLFSAAIYKDTSPQVYHVLVKNHVYKHFLCVVVPRRLEKYKTYLETPKPAR